MIPRQKSIVDRDIPPHATPNRIEYRICHLQRLAADGPTRPFHYADPQTNSLRLVKHQTRDDVPVAVDWEFAGAEEDDPSIVPSVLHSFFQEDLSSEGIGDLNATLVRLYPRVSEAEEPPVAPLGQQLLKRFVTKAPCTNAAARPNVEKDWRFEPSVAFSGIDGPNELLGCVSPTPIPPGKQCQHVVPARNRQVFIRNLRFGLPGPI
jgi:hypothetical protein